MLEPEIDMHVKASLIYIIIRVSLAFLVRASQVSMFE